VIIIMNALALIRAELCAIKPLHAMSDAQASDHLMDDLDFDALDRDTLAIRLEERLGCEFSDMTVAKWQTVANVIAAVERVTRQAA
jgi:acyl carrier protein